MPTTATYTFEEVIAELEHYRNTLTEEIKNDLPRDLEEIFDVTFESRILPTVNGILDYIHILFLTIEDHPNTNKDQYQKEIEKAIREYKSILNDAITEWRTECCM